METPLNRLIRFSIAFGPGRRERISAQPVLEHELISREIPRRATSYGRMVGTTLPMIPSVPVSQRVIFFTGFQFGLVSLFLRANRSLRIRLNPPATAMRAPTTKASAQGRMPNLEHQSPLAFGTAPG